MMRSFSVHSYPRIEPLTLAPARPAPILSKIGVSMFTTDSCGSPRWQRWAEGWIKLADGLVLILSLGFVRPSWSSEWIGWMIKSRCR